MAGGVIGALSCTFGKEMPRVSIVEPFAAPAIYASLKAADGEAHYGDSDTDETIMAGLNCRKPCSITWPIIRDHTEFSFLCDDNAALLGMREYAHPEGDDPKIVSGESGASTMGLLSKLLTDPAYREMKEAMQLDENSVVLLFNTEGDTDPEFYEQVVAERP